MGRTWVLRGTLILIVLATGFSPVFSTVSQVYASATIWVGIGSYYGCPWWYYYSAYCPYYGYFGYPYVPYPSNYGYSYYAQPTQFQLNVNVDPSTLTNAVSGAGSYGMGSLATFSANQSIIQVSRSTRYVFAHWSGDYSGQNLTGTLTMDSAKTVTAVYELQYYLAVNSPANLPQVQGSGWYNSGDSAKLTLPSLVIGGNESRWVFTGWNVDGANGSVASAEVIQMGAPHTVSAVYKQQYYLTVRSDQGGVTSGSGWYDAGTQAQISASTPPNPAYGITMIFNGWNGTVTSPANQSTTVLMNAPKTVTATWRTDPTILYVTIISVLAVVMVILFQLTNRRREEKESRTLNVSKAEG